MQWLIYHDGYKPIRGESARMALSNDSVFNNKGYSIQTDTLIW